MGQATDLKALQSKMKGCRLCLEAGHDITAGAVFSGIAGAQIMIIGQAPGVTEVEAGRPFNASSGTRLFQWLEAAGIEEAEFRANQYMTSVTKCFPGKAKNGGGDRVPSKGEQDLCRPFLEREIKLVDPEIIIPIGRLAINLYFPTSRPLIRIIGQEKENDGRWLVPLPHPSGASRWHQLPENQRRIVEAVRLLKRRMQALGIK
ncbi:MAG: uracil-DNA glycosylase family protein [Anaerolineales bacterium]